MNLALSFHVVNVTACDNGVVEPITRLTLGSSVTLKSCNLIIYLLKSGVLFVPKSGEFIHNGCTSTPLKMEVLMTLPGPSLLTLPPPMSMIGIL